MEWSASSRSTRRSSPSRRWRPQECPGCVPRRRRAAAPPGRRHRATRSRNPKPSSRTAQPRSARCRLRSHPQPAQPLCSVRSVCLADSPVLPGPPRKAVLPSRPRGQGCAPALRIYQEADQGCGGGCSGRGGGQGGGGARRGSRSIESIGDAAPDIFRHSGTDGYTSHALTDRTVAVCTSQSLSRRSLARPHAAKLASFSSARAAAFCASLSSPCGMSSL